MQLTWMDAKVGDWVVTPRIGKPWRSMRSGTTRCASWPASPRYSADPQIRTATLPNGPCQLFSLRRRADGGLYDVIDGATAMTVRSPNQIPGGQPAPFSPGPGSTEGVVALCGDRLLTSYGLRSLAPVIPTTTHYTGDPWHRDGAYHQGTVLGLATRPLRVGEYRVARRCRLWRLQRLGAMPITFATPGSAPSAKSSKQSRPTCRAVRPPRPGPSLGVIEAWWRLQRARPHRNHNRSKILTEVPSITTTRISDVIQFLLQPPGRRRFFGSFCSQHRVAVHVYRTMPAQHTIEHVGNWVFRLLIGCMWWQQTL